MDKMYKTTKIRGEIKNFAARNKIFDNEFPGIAFPVKFALGLERFAKDL